MGGLVRRQSGFKKIDGTGSSGVLSPTDQEKKERKVREGDVFGKRKAMNRGEG